MAKPCCGTCEAIRIERDLTEQLSEHLPTAERIGITTVTYSARETPRVQFEAKLKGGGWITGEWQR